VVFVDSGGGRRSIIGVLAQPLLLLSKKLWLVLGVEKLLKQAAVSGSAFDGSIDYVADEGNSSNKTVCQDPSLHFGFCLEVQSTFDTPAHVVNI